jgi:hypothetical protein
MECFGAVGAWYKGCTHTHTTESDGAKAPQEVVAAYADAGYDFIFLTDHDRITGTRDLDPMGRLLIPGAEYYWPAPDNSVHYHLVALGPSGPPAMLPRDAAGVQQAVDLIRRTGALVVLAHPYWCGLTHEQVVGLEGLAGIEVFNGVCHVEVLRGLSSVHWDDLLASGKRLWGFAADDTHWRNPLDTAGCWIMVKAAARTPEAILDAIGRGRFYASNGPVFHDIRVEGKQLTVSCSPAQVVNFMAHHSRGRTVRAGGEPIVGETYEIRGDERYLRIEIVAPDGTMAWSNPIYITSPARAR